MKLSQTGMGTTKLNNIDEMYPGQSILLQTGQLVTARYYLEKLWKIWTLCKWWYNAYNGIK